RERSAEDRRSVEVVISPKGSETVSDAPELLQSEFLAQFSELADWEQTLVLSSVQRVAAMMDADALDAAPILEIGELTDAGP
ncbi:MAG: MarR family transcriptional regulator, partial [Pseudomonadota bacterium]